jgi:hypothetical protein
VVLLGRVHVSSGHVAAAVAVQRPVCPELEHDKTVEGKQQDSVRGVIKKRQKRAVLVELAEQLILMARCACTRMACTRTEVGCCNVVCAMHGILVSSAVQLMWSRRPLPCVVISYVTSSA